MFAKAAQYQGKKKKKKKIRSTICFVFVWNLTITQQEILYTANQLH